MSVDICVLGSLNVDVVTRVAALPKPGETIMGLALEHHAGGKGLNQAVAAARLGASVAMLGATGDDEGSRTLRGILRETGVDAAGVATIQGQATGQAHIAVSEAGENTIIVTSGANAAVTPEIARGVSALAPKVALCQFETPYPALAAFLEAAPPGTRTILNAAPAQPGWRDLFAKAGIVILNETELLGYADAPIPWSESPTMPSAIAGAIASELIVRSGQIIVVTLGAGGCIGVMQHHQYVLPGLPARVVDTTGAGDCYAGALAAAFSAGSTLAPAMDFANKAAAIAVERPGASTAMPTRAEIDARNFETPKLRLPGS